MMSYEQTCLIFAARYAHTRKTGAANIVVSVIISRWDELSRLNQKQIIGELKEATCNFEDWNRLKDLVIKEERGG